MRPGVCCTVRSLLFRQRDYADAQSMVEHTTGARSIPTAILSGGTLVRCAVGALPSITEVSRSSSDLTAPQLSSPRSHVSRVQIPRADLLLEAPQYPFPCAIQDCLAAYLYLTRPPPGAPHRPVRPEHIIIAGDSAGGGLVLALLQILRDTEGLELPAGAVLISPVSCHLP